MQQQTDLPDHHYTPPVLPEECMTTTQGKKIQDIQMADPHHLWERGKTEMHPMQNSKSRILCDIPTPPDASRMVAC